MDNLKISEEYSVSRNRWSSLPPLILARNMPGSILLPSQRSFCFCGDGQDCETLNSIERLDKGTIWKLLALDGKVKKDSSLASALFEGSIMLFGGIKKKVMHKFTEEGQLEEALSDDPLTPGYMTFYSFTVQDEKILALATNKHSLKTEIREFQKGKWAIL